MATTESIMSMAAEKAVREEKWETIEWLFQPTTTFELLLRISFEAMVEKFYEWVTCNDPDAMPHRFRDEPYRIGRAAIEREEFYRRMKAIHDTQSDTNRAENAHKDGQI